MIRSLLAAAPSWMLIAFASSAFAQQPKSIDMLSYERAIPTLSRYCIEPLCLGMTGLDVNTLGEVDMGNRILDGQVTCSARGPGNKVGGLFTAPNGRLFRIAFELVSKNGVPASRYRLTFISRLLPEGSPAELDQLTKSLVSQFGPMQNGAADLWFTLSDDGQFLINVNRFPAGTFSQGASQQVVLVSRYTHFDRWLLTLPECKNGLAKP